MRASFPSLIGVVAFRQLSSYRIPRPALAFLLRLRGPAQLHASLYRALYDNLRPPSAAELSVRHACDNLFRLLTLFSTRSKRSCLFSSFETYISVLSFDHPTVRSSSLVPRGLLTCNGPAVHLEVLPTTPLRSPSSERACTRLLFYPFSGVSSSPSLLGHDTLVLYHTSTCRGVPLRFVSTATRLHFASYGSYGFSLVCVNCASLAFS